MLRLINLEEIQTALLSTSRLVDLISQKDTSFLSEVKRWLISLESILVNNKLPEASKIGSLRGAIISAELGIVPDGFTQPIHTTTSKLKNGVALQAIKKASETMFELIQKDLDRLSEAERIVNQIIAVANSKNLLNTLPVPRSTDILKSFWVNFSKDSDLSAGTVSVEGLIGPYDSLIVFDRSLGRFLM